MLKLNYFLFEQLKRWRERGKISDKIRSDKMSLCLLAYYCSPPILLAPISVHCHCYSS